MEKPTDLLRALGGESGCWRLAGDFYARVGKDPALRPLFPGKSLRCATEEFASFLIQFLGGDEEQTQHRWWLSLRESHARFKINAAARAAWLGNMNATLLDAPLDDATRNTLQHFFLHSSAYVTGKEEAESPAHPELAARWSEQKILDHAIAAIAAGRDEEALALAPRFATRPTVFAGLLARMWKSGRQALLPFTLTAIEQDPSLRTSRFGGRPLLHLACAAGVVPAVESLLRLGADPNMLDRGGHAPLYAVANECALAAGVQVVLALVRAGADVNACGGVTRATALHMAARRDFIEIAAALLDCGAAIHAPDKKGVTPLQRAVRCRAARVAKLLSDRGARNL